MPCKYEIKTIDEYDNIYYLCSKNIDYTDFMCKKNRQKCYEDADG